MLGCLPPRMTTLLPPRAPYPPRRSAGFLDSFGHAWNGLIHTAVHQRNMRLHLVSALLVGLVGSGIPLGLAEKVTLIFCVLLIFFAEILNSALEQLVDLAVQQFDEKARLTKDAAAAGVLVLAFGTVVIFAAILAHNQHILATHVPEILRQVALGVPLAACTAWLVLPHRRPAITDGLAFALAAVLNLLIAMRSPSHVFSVLTFGIVVVAAAAARQRQREFRA